MLKREIFNLEDDLNNIKNLEKSNVEEIEINSKFATIENTNNGYLGDIKLKGSTLKNLIGSQGKLSITLNNSTKSKLYELLEPIQANTDIFIRVSITGKKAPINGLKINVQNEDGTFDYFNGFTGVYDQAMKIRHTKNITHLGFYMPQGEFDADSTANITFEKAQVTLNDVGISYFEGIESVGDNIDNIVLSSVDGKGNLIDEVIKPNVISDVFIPKGNYVASCKASSGTIRYYRQDGSNIDHWSLQGEGTIYRSFTTNEDIYKILFDVSEGATELQIVQGVEPVPYKPHKQDKKQLLYLDAKDSTWKKPVLREWDTVEKHSDGKYYYHKRRGEVVLNGSETWYATGSVDGNCLFFRHPNITSVGVKNIISDKFKWEHSYADNEHIFYNSEGLHIAISKTKLETQDVAGFKKWLQANNVTVVYQLAQEEVYECTNIDLISYSGLTNYSVNSGAVIPKSIFKVENHISNVVTLLQEKVSILEQNVNKGNDLGHLRTNAIKTTNNIINKLN